MAVNVAITNETARVVGLIARKHEECSIQIEWREIDSEQTWIITATNGAKDFVYLVDDEHGHWAPATEAELRRLAGGLPVFETA